MMYLTRSEQLELELSCANDEIIKLQKQLADERDALKAKLADSEAALHRFQHGQQIEGDYICEAAEKERAARLKAEAACIAKNAAIWFATSAIKCGDPWTERCENTFSAALSSDSGQPVIEFIAAARRLNDGVKLFIKVMAGEVRADKECPSFPQLVADVDAAEAKLGGK